MPGPYKLDQAIWAHVCDTFRIGEVFTIPDVVASLPTELRALSNVECRVRDTFKEVMAQPQERMDGHVPIKRVDNRSWML
jgi:hypothetical protein